MRRTALLPPLAVVAAAAVVLGATSLPAAASSPMAASSPVAARGPERLTMETVSTRAGFVTGGDVLVRIDGVRSVDRLRVTAGGRDVSRAFTVDPGGLSASGLVDGLRLGRTDLVATQGRERTRLRVVNHPASGPIISGPHETPYACTTAQWRTVTGASLGTPTDADCSAPTRVDYAYGSTDGTMKPLADPRQRPDDLATTTTTTGATVPFLVRVETGTVNRAVYEVAMLHDPSTPAPTRTTRSPGWNNRLLLTFGGGCRGGWYSQGTGTGGVLDRELISRGYVVASSSLNVFGNNCNDLLASETAIMLKEKVVERFGAPRFTIGWGCSGGSYQGHQIADNYPGVLDGVVAGCSFPDVTSATNLTLLDARVLDTYFTKTAPGTFTTEQQRAVAGFGVVASIPNLSDGAKRLDPDEEFPAALAPELRYDAQTNPDGARGTVFDHTVNVYGRDRATGFALRPLDNTGIEYGLAALDAGTISWDQFVDLNRRVGGIDRDANPVPRRTVADRSATEAAYRTGRILDTGAGLATTPVIDYRAYTDRVQGGDIHMNVHGFSTRARLVERNGTAANHVMLEEDDRHGLFGLTSPVLRGALTQMDEWLTRLSTQTGTRTTASVAAAKPRSLTDACWTRDTTPRKIEQTLSFDNRGECGRLYPAYPTPRMVGGAPLTDDVVACAKKPVDASDYRQRPSSAQLRELRAVFPTGVCDWNRKGIGQKPLAGTWQVIR